MSGLQSWVVTMRAKQTRVYQLPICRALKHVDLVQLTGILNPHPTPSLVAIAPQSILWLDNSWRTT